MVLMSEQLTLAEARERLYARLWPNEIQIDAEDCMAIAQRRLWRALEEQRFHIAQDKEPVLQLGDLTEQTRRTAFTRDPPFMITDPAKFDLWLALVSALTATPKAPFITGVEAVSFLGWGAFLSDYDHAAITAGIIERQGKIQVVGAPKNTAWEAAEQKLFLAHVEGTVSILGRKAAYLHADAEGDLVPVPREFFAGHVTLWLFNGIIDVDHIDRPIYREIALSTAEFDSAFVTSQAAPAPEEVTRLISRAPRPGDAKEFLEWTEGLHSSRGFGPSMKEAEEFAAKRRISREWARTQRAALPAELQRPRGGKGSTKFLRNRPTAT
jgi:hypothetical protein